MKPQEVSENSNTEYIEAANTVDYLYKTNGFIDNCVPISKMEEYRNEFKKQYSMEQLTKHNGMDIWGNIWDHGQGNGMIYALRHNEKYRLFGSAQSSDVASLPMHLNRNGNYYAGKNNKIIGLKESLKYGEEFRDKFVECIKAINNMQLETIDDFIKLGKYLDENLDGKGEQMWVHKYLHMFFPDKFSQFHSYEFKRNILCVLGIMPNKSFYGMAGQLYLIKKNTKINDFYLFAQVMYKNYKGIGKDEVYLIYVLDSALSTIEKWEPNSHVGLDTRLFDNLYDNLRFQQKTNNDKDEQHNHLFVVMYHEKPLGIVDSLIPKQGKDKVDVRYGTWHCCFSGDDRIPIDSRAKKDKSKAVDNPAQLILVYKRYYESYSNKSELEDFIWKKADVFALEYKDYVDRKISAFKAEYPQDKLKLQTKFIDNGINAYYNSLVMLSEYDGYKRKIVDMEDMDTNELMYWTAMIILNEQSRESKIVPIEYVVLILSIYYPEKYMSIWSNEYLDLALDELGIQYADNQSIWIKQQLLRNWICKKMSSYTEDCLVQNYIFVRGLKEWGGIPFYKSKPVKYIKLESVNENVKQEYEMMENVDEPLFQNKITIPIEVPCYKGEPQEKIFLKEKDSRGRTLPKRDSIKRINAAVIADFKCEVNPEHTTFISRATGKPYVESHHLIPMEFYDEFDNSLDVEENIVCLCSNCHNEIHYGIDSEKLVRKIYRQRKELLHNAGLDITEDELVSKAYKLTCQ